MSRAPEGEMSFTVVGISLPSGKRISAIQSGSRRSSRRST